MFIFFFFKHVPRVYIKEQSLNYLEHISDLLFRFEISVYDSETVKVLQRQSQFSEVEFDVFFSEHNLKVKSNKAR